MVLGDLDSYMQKNKTRPPTYAIHKNKFKMDKRLKYKSWHHKSPLGEHCCRKISDIPCSNIFTNMSPTARDIKERINKWDLIKIKSFCMGKGNSIKMKRELIIRENVFANNTSDKSLSSKIYKELKWLHSKKTRNPIKNGQKTWTDTSPRRTYRGPRDAQYH